MHTSIMNGIQRVINDWFVFLVRVDNQYMEYVKVHANAFRRLQRFEMAK